MSRRFQGLVSNYHPQTELSISPFNKISMARLSKLPLETTGLKGVPGIVTRPSKKHLPDLQPCFCQG